MSELEWDFGLLSDSDKPLTDGEDDLQFLIERELESESEDDLHSWGNEEEDDSSSSSAGYPPAKRFRAWADSEDDNDDEEEEAPVEDWGSGDEEFSGSSAGGSYDADDEGSEDQ
jgi:hypothetical protein